MGVFKMKTETKIAKFNIKTWKREDMDTFIRVYYYACEQHKASCERFLEFLEELKREIESEDMVGSGNMEKYCEEFESFKIHLNKITDLKQAIKLYNEAGI